MKRIALSITMLLGLLSGSLSLLVAPNIFAAANDGKGLRGDYFSDANLTTLALSRVDATANFNWQSGAPAAGLPKDNFTVRWAGQVVPRFSEKYAFRITADDGARLWINGNRVIDAWSKAYGGVSSSRIALQAGQRYDLKLEYREQTGSASMKLAWSSPRQRLEIVPQSQLIAASTSVPAPTSTPQPAAAPTNAPPANEAPKLLFGIGAEADSAIKARLTTEAPVRMLTSWYNSPNNLSWVTSWKNGLVPRAYAAGYALHLIVFSDIPESQFATKYGTACGRTYPLSDQFLSDMRQLAQTFAGQRKARRYISRCSPNSRPMHAKTMPGIRTRRAMPTTAR